MTVGRASDHHSELLREANIALNQTMADYAGLVRSETMLEAGLKHLRLLKRKLHETCLARDQWELTRCLEVVNLYDIHGNMTIDSTMIFVADTNTPGYTLTPVTAYLVGDSAVVSRSDFLSNVSGGCGNSPRR